MARPRSARDVLTLGFVVLALAAGVALAVADVVRHAFPAANLAWAAVLLLLGLGSRTYAVWRREIADLTAERARLYLASLLLVACALSLSWHFLVSALGFSTGYLLPGFLDSPPWTYLALGLALATALCLLLNAPVGALLLAFARTIANTLDSASSPRTLESAEVSDLLLLDFEDPDVEPEEPAPEESAETALPARPLLDQTAARPAPSGAPVAEVLPPVDLFVPPAKGPAAKVDLELVARRIEECLASFNVAARVVGHHLGPVVTQFDVQPDRGVKVKSIVALQNDLALALAAPTIRIQAPVPGKPVVGIEIPNTSATLVTLRELLESEQYRASSSPLRVPLGKDVAGGASVIDLAKMPHLLIAGATGSGKSACVNSIISSLLYQSTPEQVRLMMIDPKMVELAVYNGVPHLLSPVVTQMDKVVGVLQWALREMERRYQLFAETSSRNVTRFNEKAESLGLKKLPYIVLIIDELADLMMVSPEDVEDAICRLAQLARAAGIHLVIATQRPSVDVVTGLIKANFPARIAFAMTSQVDSRTILDTVGAEKLLGRGDMLYQPPDAPKPVRLQGAWVSDYEVERLVEFWKRVPLQMAIQKIAEEEFATLAKAAADEDDELLGDAIRVVREYQHASVSLLQRRLKIGYARAARVMDQLEAHGIVGPADGSKQRPVLDPDAEPVS